MTWKNNIIDFFAYLLFPNGFSSRAVVQGKAKSAQWKKVLLNSEARKNYLAAEWKKLVLVTIWVCANIGLFIEACVRYNKILSDKKLPSDIVWFVTFARGFGQLLNFNCALLILPVMRNLLHWLRIFKLDYIIPLDKNLVFHRYLAYWVVFCTIGHGFFHYLNYAKNFAVYSNSQTAVTSPIVAAWVQKYGITGNLLVLVMYLMYATSHRDYRKSRNYTVFWYTHHLFIIFYVLLLVHGKVFWIWFLPCSLLYIIERLLRNVRGSEETIVKRVHGHPSNVIELVLQKPRFNYKSGQYCFINCPLISKHEWHAMTISSSPEEEDIHFHIKCAGDWTKSLMDLFNPQRSPTVVINKPKTPNNKDYLIKLDGPFGTSASEAKRFETVMLVAAGIGATPYSSLLRHFRTRLLEQAQGRGKPLKVKQCFFYFINRDKGGFEWFNDLLVDIETNHPEFFQIVTFMTGNLQTEEIKKLYFGSSEYQDSGNEVNFDSTYRVLEDYDPKSSDEIALTKNDLVLVHERDNSGWWKGVNLTTNEKGLFRSEHLALVDNLTGLKENKNRQYGRPDWVKEFGNVRKWVETHTPNINEGRKRPQIGVFVCGPAGLSKDLYDHSIKESTDSSVQFVFHKENF
ncbi:hypothetical protein ABK040_001779 [Willaertia magna]